MGLLGLRSNEEVSSTASHDLVIYLGTHIYTYTHTYTYLCVICIWLVVKITVLFWVLSLLRHFVLRDQKGDHNVDSLPYCLDACMPKLSTYVGPLVSFEDTETAAKRPWWAAAPCQALKGTSATVVSLGIPFCFLLKYIYTPKESTNIVFLLEAHGDYRPYFL